MSPLEADELYISSESIETNASKHRNIQSTEKTAITKPKLR